MLLDYKFGSQSLKEASLVPMTVNSNSVTVTDGAHFFVTLSREDLVKLLASIDAEKAREEHEDGCTLCGTTHQALHDGLCGDCSKNVISKSNWHN